MSVRGGMTSGPGGWLYRIAPSAFAALLFAGFAALWHFDLGLYLAVMGRYIWTTPGALPFSDLNAVLRAGVCWAQGVDVYAHNACMNGGSYNYSPFLLGIGLLGAGPRNVLPGGVLLSLAFIASCALLPPSRTRGELALRCAVICSCAVVHGMECGNIDLAMFVLCAAGVVLQRAGFAWRVCGYALFLLGGALKFYPAILLTLVLRESRLRVAGIGMLLVLGGIVVLWRHGQELSGVLSSLPLGLPFRGSFGAVNLPFGIALLSFMSKPTVLPEGSVFEAALHHPHMAAYVVIGSKCLVVAGLFAGLRLAPRYAGALAALDEGGRLFLSAGALLLAFCFYTAPNYEYRGVFLLFTVPGLCAMAMTPTRPAGIWPALMLATMPLLLWERVLWQVFQGIGGALPAPALLPGLGVALWLLRECGWWFVAIQLTAIGMAYARAAALDLIAGPANRRRLATGED